MALTEFFTERNLPAMPVGQSVVVAAQMSLYSPTPSAHAQPIVSHAALLRMFAFQQLNAKMLTVLLALQTRLLLYQHAWLATWATILPQIAPVGLLFHAGTSKFATLLLHLDYITLNQHLQTLHSRPIAR